MMFRTHLPAIAFVSFILLLLGIIFLHAQKANHYKNVIVTQSIQGFVKHKIGDNLIPCGIVGIGENLKPLNLCVQKAEAENTPYWAAYEVRDDEKSDWKIHFRTEDADTEEVLLKTSREDKLLQVVKKIKCANKSATFSDSTKIESTLIFSCIENAE